MKNEAYKHRIIDTVVEQYLHIFGAVCIEGPKWCGKTWTSRFHCSSEYLVGNPDNNFQNRRLAEMSPSLILPGDAPRMIGEWQEVPPIWDAIRYEVDKRGARGQFILTGSSTPKVKGILHSGAGRIGRLRMHTMSLYEADRSSGQVSLKELCDEKMSPIFTGEVDLNDLVDNIIRGGWPGNQDLPLKDAALLTVEYMNAVAEDEVHRIDGIQRDKHKVLLLLRSLAAALLRATPEKLIGNLNTLGFLFESLCERDLRIYAESFGAKLYHYQDYAGREIDAVIELDNGDWCAFEIKLDANKIDEGAESLNKIRMKIKEDGGKPPKICCVICGLSNAAYQREDGVFVVPITALKN